MEIRRYTSENVPKALGPYSPATVINCGDYEIIETSGIIGLGVVEPKLVSENIVEQTEAALNTLNTILKENNATLKDVVKVVIYVIDLEDYKNINETYMKYFPDNFPSRTCVQVSKLPANAKIEIEARAYRKVTK